MENESMGKQGIEYFIGIFTGKIYKSTGTKQDGTAWTRWSLQFLNDTNMARKFNCFTPIKNPDSLQVDELIEAQRYMVGYYTKPFQIPDGDLIQIKTIVFIKEISQDNIQGMNTPINQQVAGNTPPTPPNVQSQQSKGIIETPQLPPQQTDSDKLWYEFKVTNTDLSWDSWTKFIFVTKGLEKTPNNEQECKIIYEKNNPFV